MLRFFCRISLTLVGLMILLASPISAQTLIHSYRFQGNLDDTMGGPALVSGGGVIGANNYAFGRNQGLTLTNAIPTDNYSIDMKFKLTSDAAWNKLIDFKGQTTDNGLYAAYDNYISLWHDQIPPSLDGSAIYTTGYHTNQLLDVVFTRDSATKTVTTYVNGAYGFSFNDANNESTFSGVNALAVFFKDDNQTGYGESASGYVNKINIFDGALSADQVATMYKADPIPELSTSVTLCMVLFLSILFLYRHRTCSIK